jgi:ABC-type antimicrobial peptide transport system permease subunit
MEIDDVIIELKKLDLSSYPGNQIRSLVSKFGFIASMVVNYNPGKSVIRARPYDEGVRFKLKNDLLYKPQEFNKTYQRASTPYDTMLYAIAVPDEPKLGELDNMRIIGIAETIISYSLQRFLLRRK